MAERTEASVSAAVYSVPTELGEQILLQLRQSESCVFDVQSVENQRSLFSCAANVVLMAVDRGAGDSSESENDVFSTVYQLLESLKAQKPFCQVIVLIAGGLSIEPSCRLIRQGIFGIVDYLQTNFVATLNEKVFAADQRARELADHGRAERVRESYRYCGLVGRSEEFLRVIQKSQRASRVSDAPVIIYGESGTGKQLIAEYIHQIDEKRKGSPFVSVNCSAIAGTLAESELFGHRKGAFTGATEDRLGYFRAANGGTILLDEISELEPALQPKILRVLQESVVMPVGSDREYRVDVRVIAATNRDLRQMIEKEQFRLDLYQRLNVIQLHVPPLRQRVEDLPILVENFLQKYRHYYHGEIRSVQPEVYEVLRRAIGRGNVRELENIVRQILVFKENGDRIELTDLPGELIAIAVEPCDRETPIGVSDHVVESICNGSKRLSEAVEEFEKVMLQRLIQRGLNQTLLADRLGITRRTLYNKIQKYKL